MEHIFLKSGVWKAITLPLNFTFFKHFRSLLFHTGNVCLSNFFLIAFGAFFVVTVVAVRLQNWRNWQNQLPIIIILNLWIFTLRRWLFLYLFFAINKFIRYLFMLLNNYRWFTIDTCALFEIINFRKILRLFSGRLGVCTSLIAILDWHVWLRFGWDDLYFLDFAFKLIVEIKIQIIDKQ